MKTRRPVLTQEERDVLILVAQHPRDQHLTNEEIAQRLGISVSRVKTVIHQACVKLEAHNRNQAVLFAAKRREISFTELLSLDEQAELLCPLGPDGLRRIAQLVREGRKIGDFLEQDEQIICPERCQDGILTNRERDVLILVGRGLTNDEIAETLYITPSAVRTFLNRASNKLGARKRADAVRLALRQREIVIGDIFSLDDALQDLASLGAESFEKIAQLLEQRAGEGSNSTSR